MVLFDLSVGAGHVPNSKLVDSTGKAALAAERRRKPNAQIGVNRLQATRHHLGACGRPIDHRAEGVRVPVVDLCQMEPAGLLHGRFGHIEEEVRLAVVVRIDLRIGPVTEFIP